MLPIRCLLPLLAVATPLAAATVRDLDLPPCVPLAQPVAIDGALGDWAGVDGIDWKPLKGVFQSDLRAGREDVGAGIRTAYDAQALYLAIDWSSPTPPRGAAVPALSAGGDGLELHLRIEGRVLHVVSAPLPDGRSASLLLRRGAASESSDLRSVGGAAAVALRTGGWTHELRIPWSVLRPEGVPAAGRTIDAAIDLAWSALAGQGVAAIDPGLRRNALHVSHNALTARHRLHSAGYLPDPNDWGVLRLGAQAVPAAQRYAAAGTGFCELVAAQAATAPRIDGQLPADEWPAVGFATSARDPELLGRRNAYDLAARWDADNLYLAARVASPAAPFNSAHEKDQDGYGGGDCLQLRLERAGRRINLCAWPQTDGSVALTADGRDLAQPFLLQAGAVLAIRHDPAAGSYVMEMALPWQALFAGQPGPTAGETLRATAQAWWVGHGERWCAMGGLVLQERGALELAWQNPQAGLVTLGLYDRAGALLRWITRADSRPAGANRESWDGLDQWGQPLPAGSYTVKGLTHPPLTLEHRATVGNAGSPPWPTSDGKGDWLSDECPPQAAATDGDWVFLAAPGSEKGWAVMAVDGEGRRQWGKDLPFYPRCVSLAVDGDRLYAAFSGPERTDNKPFDGKNAEEVATLVTLDKRTGAPLGASAKGLLHRAATFPYRPAMVRMSALRRDMAFTPAIYAGQPRYYASDVGDTANVVGIAAMGGKVYLSCYLDDRILVLDGETAAKLDEIALPDPVGLAATAQGLLAVSGRSVVRIDPASRRITPLINAGLDAPHSVCTDRAGEIYVSDWGKAFQVKVFAADGSPRRAIGRPGGRPWVGAFATDGMLLPRGIAVTAAGRLWVAEDDCCPRRISVWDAKAGGLVRDFIGPISYGGATPFWVDPADDRVVYSQGARFQVDWEKQTATPQATMIRQLDPADPFTFNASYSHCDGTRTIRRDGREYVLMVGNQQAVVMLRQGERLVTVAALGGHNRTDAVGTGVFYGDGSMGYRMFPEHLPAFFAGHQGQNYAWSDADGDGIPQAGEMTWAKTRRRGDEPQDGVQPEWSLFWGAGIGPDFSVYFTGVNRSAGSIWRVTPTGFTASGAPQYDITTAVRIQQRLSPEGKQHPSYSGLHVDDQDRIYVTYGFEWWPSGLNPVDRNALECLDRDGKVLWSVAMPKDLRRTTWHATNVIDSFTLPGIGGVIGSWNWHGNYRPYLLTSDGLYIDTMLEDSKVGPYANWDESYRRFFKSPDGTPNIVNNGSTAHHISAIRGLDQAKRFELPLSITAEEARTAAAMRDLPAAAKPIKPVIGVAWAASAPVIDGALEDWTEAPPVVLRADGKRGAEVMLARDRDNLYLSWQVQDPSPLLNLGDDWQRLFITGDCVDLMLAGNAKADPARKEPVAGDQRLLFSVFQGKPIAVLYKAVVPGAKAPVRFVSVTMDEVRRLDEAKVAFSRAGASYVIEASVPLAALGLDPAGTDGLRGDVGVVFSDQTGRNRELRLYHWNRDTAMTADLPTETRLQPANWGALRLPLGRNLLRNGGFEEPLSSGWRIDAQVNGAVARTSDDGAYSGRQCLVLEQAEPRAVPEAALKEANFDAFTKTLAGGHISIGQSVPVTAGARYSVRLLLRSEGFGDRLQPGDPQRGYASMTPFLFWVIPGAQPVVQSVVTHRYNDLETWTEFRDNSSGYSVTQQLTAPAGATSLGVCFKSGFVTVGRLPKVWVDDVEVVEGGR